MTTKTTIATSSAHPGNSDSHRGFILFHRYHAIPENIREALAEAEAVSGINRTELRMRLTGPGVGALNINRPLDIVTKCAADLNAIGLKTAVVDKKKIQESRLPAAAKKIQAEGASLDFEDADGETIFRITDQTDLLIIITDLSGQTVRQRMTVMTCAEKAIRPDFEESLKRISIARPAAVFYALNENPVSGVYVDTAAFSFMGLGDQLTNARGTNFRVMIEQAVTIARSCITDDNFGLSLLPGANPDWKSSKSAIERELGRYGQYLIAAAHAKIIPPEPETGNAPCHDLDPSKDKDSEGPDDPPSETAALKPPPDVTDSRIVTFFQTSMPEIIAGLIVFMSPVSLLMSGARTVSAHPVFFQAIIGGGIVIAGFCMFYYSLMMLHYRRMVENTPTSKIRSLSMGMVELSGKTSRYYDLRTSATQTPCVFYNCRYYKLKKTNEGSHWSLTRSVSSGKIPFYIEDDTGRVLVNPRGAVFKFPLATQTFSGGFIPSLSMQLYDPDKKVTEDLIPTGARVYILGSAKIERHGRDTRTRIIDKLRVLKQTPEALKAYDTNGDGQVDGNEWEEARNDVTTQVYAESLTDASANAESVVVGKPRFGLLPFIVADSEQGLVRQLMLRTWIFLAGGIITMGFSIRFLSNLFG